MKKFSFLFLMALSIATVFTSCGDDEEVISTTPPTLVKEYTATLLLPPLSGNTSETFFSTRNGKRYSFTTAASGANSDSEISDTSTLQTLVHLLCHLLTMLHQLSGMVF